MAYEEKWPIFRDEILRIMYVYDSMASGVRVVESNGSAEVVNRPLSEAELLCMRRQCNQALLDACNRHKREFTMLAGEPVETQVHYGTATVQAVAGA